MKKLLAIFTLFSTLTMTTNTFAALNIEDAIESGVVNCQTTIDVSECNATPDEIMNVFAEMFNTNPAMANLDGTIECAYTNDKATSITVGYANAQIPVANSQKATDKAINNIVAEAKNKTDKIEQAKFVHDYLIENTEYDYTYAADTMYDLLVNGKGTCNAYSLTYKAAMDKLGIDCTVVLENDKSHAWNQIVVDGKWYNVDVTWDVNYAASGASDSTFFMKSDDFFKSNYHKSWKSNYVCDMDL